MVQKAGHPIARRAAKENYVETGAVTLGALYCSARLRLPRGKRAGEEAVWSFSSSRSRLHIGAHGREKRRREWDVPSGGGFGPAK